MATTTRDIITRALRRIRVVGITQDAPAEHATHARDVLCEMITSWERGLNTAVKTLTGDFQADVLQVTGLFDAQGNPTTASDNLYSAYDLSPDMAVSGTGIASGTRIWSIDSKDQITLDTAPTANGTGVSLSFTPIPFDDSLTAAIVAVLAYRLAEDYGQAVGPILKEHAVRGQAEIDGAFLYIPTRDQLDRALVEVPSSRFYDGSDDIVNG